RAWFHWRSLWFRPRGDAGTYFFGSRLIVKPSPAEVGQRELDLAPFGMPLLLENWKVLAQRPREPRQIILRPLQVVVIGHEERLHREARYVIGQQIRITVSAHRRRKVGPERGFAGRVVRVELQQLDELSRLGLHVDEQLGRLPGDHGNDVNRLV